MSVRRDFFFWLRVKVTDLAHTDFMLSGKGHGHDFCEFIAYKIIDPLIWL